MSTLKFQCLLNNAIRRNQLIMSVIDSMDYKTRFPRNNLYFITENKALRETNKINDLNMNTDGLIITC